MALAEEILGYPGAMLGSKSRYSSRNPDHFIIFNANVCIQDGKIWWGDLDITNDISRLFDLANKLKETIYVLYEMDGRFENESNPKIERFAIKCYPNGKIEFGKSILDYFEYQNGKIRKKNGS